MIKRTHTCGEITSSHIGNTVSLNGWISKTRDLGGLHFIDIRDRFGSTQIVFNKDINHMAFERVKKLGFEEAGKEDFGQTLGVWGARSGCYFVLPILGPTTARDSVGMLADSFVFAVSKDLHLLLKLYYYIITMHLIY